MVPHVVELRDDENNLHRKAITPPGCLAQASKLVERIIWYGLICGVSFGAGWLAGGM